MIPVYGYEHHSIYLFILNLRGFFRLGIYCQFFWEAVGVLSLVTEGYLCVDRLNQMASLIR